MLSIFRISVNIKESEGDNKEDGPASSFASQPIEANGQRTQPGHESTGEAKSQQRGKAGNEQNQEGSKEQEGVEEQKETGFFECAEQNHAQGSWVFNREGDHKKNPEVRFCMDG